MRIQNILLVSLFISLYGCQPEVPAQQAAAPAEGSLHSSEAPAAVTSSVAPTPAEQVTSPAVSEAAVTVPVKPVPVEKAAQPAAKEEIAVAQKEKVSQTATVAEVKPEVPPEPAVSEADAMQLAKKNNCFSCHAVGKKVVGPAFRDVAVKYRDDAGAEARLVAKIAKGGSGVWGVMVMPPSPKISEADRRILTKWVLSLK